MYFISKGPPKYNFIEIKRSKDQGFQIYLTVSMMTKVNELGTNIYKQVVYYLPVVVSKNLIFGTRGSYKADRGITI